VKPLARVPFSGKVRDDHGLDSVEFNYNFSPVSSQPGQNSAPVVSALQLTPGATTPAPAVASYLAWLARVTRGGDDLKPLGKEMLPGFARALRDRAATETPLAALPERLKEKPQGTLLRDHSLDPVEELFDVERLGLRVSGDNQVQPHYRLRLWVVATDNNVETGPGAGQSKERFTFLVVSENELLTEIAKEEEGLHLKMEDTLSRLKEARGKLDQVMQEMPQLKPEEFSPMARRAEEVAEVVVKTGDITREIHTDYRRILKELQANRVQPGVIARVERDICGHLEIALNDEFIRAEEAARAFQKVLEERKADKPAADLARAQLERLIDRLTRALLGMGDLMKINQLIALLVEIEKGERKEFERLKKLRDDLQEKILDDVLTPLDKK
jgi:hypothetical protein